ncbi:MAG: hypothetical protein SWO11_19465 [Thermodesulfobacteriota bacterium]|nr:hypothetical protein [Thermodesulfobacteriota bacterium]
MASSGINEDTMNDRTGIIPEENLEEAKEMVELWQGRTYQDVCSQYQNRREKVLMLMGEYVQPGRDITAFDYVTP